MSSSLFGLNRAGLRLAGEPLLKPVNLQLARHRVTAIIGPVATGKSVLLSALAGSLSEGVQREGQWLLNGRELPLRGGCGSVVWLRQSKARERSSMIGALEAALKAPTDALLLDEPDSGLNTRELSQLARSIREYKVHGSVAIVTHNMDVVRDCADDVVLLCASEVIASDTVRGFFDNPPNELSRKWIATGSCWPERKPPPLPKAFHWVLEKQLAGTAWPGLLGDVELELEAIALSGVTLLVSLTERPFSREHLAAYGIEGRHFPIVDMGVPGVGNTIRLCRGIQRAIAAGGAVAVHCRAGLGRTGTILACYLVFSGASPEVAIEQVRRLNPQYIQSASQLEFVRQFNG